MAKILYFVVTFLESGLAIFGIRAGLHEPPYRVVARLSSDVEIRAYGPLVAAETTSTGDDDAFSRLFAYITGANASDAMIAMTAPVEQSGAAMAGGGRTGDLTMRFFLPPKIAADPPKPKDSRVRIVAVPARDLAVIRFSGSFGRRNLERHLDILKGVLAKAGRTAEGPPVFLGYDPPFTIPALRRNEVAVPVGP